MAAATEETSAMEDSLPSSPPPPLIPPTTDTPPSQPPRPSLHRQRTVFIQRLRLDETEQRSCTAILQRIDALHRLSLEGSTSHPPSLPSSSSSRSQSASSSEQFDDAAEWKLDTEGGEEDDEGEDGDGVLVTSPSVHLHDCVFAVNDAQSKLAVAYARHLFIHPLLGRTAAASSDSSSSSSQPSSPPRYRDDIGEVDLEQRVQFAQTAAAPDSADPTVPYPSLSMDDDDAAQHAKLMSDRSVITALCWYQCEERDWLLVGNGSGLFRCYHSSGRLLFAHTFHASAIRQIKPFYATRSQLSASLSDFSDSIMTTEEAKAAPHPAGASSSSSSSSSSRSRHRVDVLVVHEDSLCVIDGKSIRTFLRVDLQAQSSLFSTTRRESLLLSLQQLKDGVWRHDRWRLLEHGQVEDAVRCERIAPVTIDELFAPPASSFTSSDSPYFLVAGADPSLAYYSPSSQPFTLASAVSAAGQLGGMVANAVKDKVFGFAKSWWTKEAAKFAPAQPALPSSFPSQYTAAPLPVARKKVKRSLPTPQTAPLTDLPLTRALRDSPRAVLSIRLDPLCGHWAVCADSLGRVSLLETDHLLVTRMWKGYREAKTAWMVLANEPGQDGAGHSAGDDVVGGQASRRHSQPDALVFLLPSSPPPAAPAPLSLFLLLYAPRRGLLELWAVPHGKRSAPRTLRPPHLVKWCHGREPTRTDTPLLCSAVCCAV